MLERASVEDAISRIAAGVEPPLIAIDGLPCSGKSTIVARLEERMALDCIYLDDFVLPERDWPSGIGPAFPFKYMRYGAFMEAVRSLAVSGTCTYRPFDWDAFEIADSSRTVTVSKPVVIEGVSSLYPALCPFYGLKIFVESDRATTLRAALDRGMDRWHDQWRDLFLPSVDIYIETRPQERADMLIAGRGA